jgi:hypothetical protein
MDMKTIPVLGVLLLPWLLTPSATLAGEEKRFDPEKCFPLESLGYLRVQSGAGLAAALGDTLAGRIVSDPEVHASLGDVPAMARALIRQSSGPLIELTGRDPLKVLGLFQGELVISIVGLDPAAKVSVLAALELGTEREAILATVEKIGAGLSRAAGRQLPEVAIGSRKTVAWPILNGLSAVYPLVLGSHIVFATSPQALQGVAEAFDGAPGAEDFCLGASPRLKEANGALGSSNPRLLAFANLEAIRGLLMMFMSRDPDSKEMVKALRATGLLTITTLGLSIGSGAGDGGLETKLLLGTEGSDGRGFLGELLGSLSSPAGSAEALALVPAEALSVSAAGVDAGKALRAIHALMQQVAPRDVIREINDRVRDFEERTNLSLENDLFKLGKIDLWSCAVMPPAGGFPDSLVFARTAELAPYRTVAEKVVRALGKERVDLPGPAAAGAAGPRIAYLRAGSIFTRLLGMKLPTNPDQVPLALLEPPISLAWADLPGGWTVCSTHPTPLLRYLARGKDARPVAGDERVAARFRSDLAGVQVLGFLRAEGSCLAVYNTVVELAGALAPFAEQNLAPLHVDPARLPPGEKFLPGLRDHWVRVTAGSAGLVIHTRGERAAH